MYSLQILNSVNIINEINIDFRDPKSFLFHWTERFFSNNEIFVDYIELRILFHD